MDGCTATVSLWLCCCHCCCQYLLQHKLLFLLFHTYSQSPRQNLWDCCSRFFIGAFAFLRWLSDCIRTPKLMVIMETSFYLRYWVWHVMTLVPCVVGSEISGARLPVSFTFSWQLFCRSAYFEGDCGSRLADKLTTAGIMMLMLSMLCCHNGVFCVFSVRFICVRCAW